MEGERKGYVDIERERERERERRKEQERKYQPDIKKVSVIHNTARKRNKKTQVY